MNKKEGHKGADGILTLSKRDSSGHLNVHKKQTSKNLEARIDDLNKKKEAEIEIKKIEQWFHNKH